MKLRDRLHKAAESALKEGVESTKNIINDNIVPAFEDMGMANVTPGEFAQEEITDAANLVNKGTMSNDTEFNKEAPVVNPVEDMIDAAKDAVEGMLDISAPEDENTLEIVKTTTDEKPEDMEEFHKKHHHDHEEHEHHHGHPFGNSGMGHIIESVMQGKTCEEYLKTLTESEYAGPRDFVPDVRINASDVLNTLKAEIGEGTEALHVDEDVDAKNNHVYKVSMIDTKKLPKELHVENVVLKLDGNTYAADKMAKDFPLKTSKN